MTAEAESPPFGIQQFDFDPSILQVKVSIFSIILKRSQPYVINDNEFVSSVFSILISCYKEDKTGFVGRHFERQADAIQGITFPGSR